MRGFDSSHAFLRFIYLCLEFIADPVLLLIQ